MSLICADTDPASLPGAELGQMQTRWTAIMLNFITDRQILALHTIQMLADLVSSDHLLGHAIVFAKVQEFAVRCNFVSHLVSHRCVFESACQCTHISMRK